MQTDTQRLSFLFPEKMVVDQKEKMKARTEINKDVQIIPLKHDLEEIDLDADVETERTTASIKSTNTPNNNPFDSDDNDEMVNQKNTGDSKNKNSSKMPRKESTDGPVKRFFNEIKDISCKNSNTAVESNVNQFQILKVFHFKLKPNLISVEPELHNIKNQSMDDIMRDNKTSKVCTIL